MTVVPVESGGGFKFCSSVPEEKRTTPGIRIPVSVTAAEKRTVPERFGFRSGGVDVACGKTGFLVRLRRPGPNFTSARFNDCSGLLSSSVSSAFVVCSPRCSRFSLIVLLRGISLWFIFSLVYSFIVYSPRCCFPSSSSSLDYALSSSIFFSCFLFHFLYCSLFHFLFALRLFLFFLFSLSLASPFLDISLSLPLSFPLLPAVSFSIHFNVIFVLPLQCFISLSPVSLPNERSFRKNCPRSSTPSRFLQFHPQLHPDFIIQRDAAAFEERAYLFFIAFDYTPPLSFTFPLGPAARAPTALNY